MEQLRKTCNECGIEKSLTEFHRHKHCKLGRTPKCKDCISSYNKKMYCSESTKIRVIKNKYGLTKEQYDAMPKYCEICKSTENLVIDHCHESEKVRGTLCSNCNKGLGMFTDDISRLTNAILYLKINE